MLRAAGVPEERWELTRAADCRYGRQAYELTVPLAAGPVTRQTLARLAADFHDRTARPTATRAPTKPVQLVNLRLAAVGRLRRASR